MPMRSVTYPLAALLALTLASFVIAPSANAQCSTCPQPTIAYSPVVQTAYSPVYQTQTVNRRTGWYLGKFVHRLFGRPDPITSVNYTTAYQPTVPTSYSVGYAPSTYTVGYAPSPYTVGYAATGCSTCGSSPCGCTTSYRPVLLSPASSCCSTCPAPCSSCATGCSSCAGGAVTAGYDYGYNGGGSSCSNCTSGSTGGVAPLGYEASPSNNGYGQQPTPAPTIAPTNPVPEQRGVQRPETPAAEANPTSAYSNETSFGAPALLPPDRTTRRPTAPVWTAVYHKDTNTQSVSTTAHRPVRRPTTRVLDASDWASVTD